MAILRVARDSGYADLLRSYSVLLNGAEIGKLKNGEARDFKIPAGDHSVRLKIDWAGSKAVSFSAGESDTIALRASSNLRGLRLLLALWYATIGASSYLLLEPDPAQASAGSIVARPHN